MTNNHPTHYVTEEPLTKHQLLAKASELLEEQLRHLEPYCDASKVKEFLRCKLSHYEREIFAVMLLDTQHRLIHFEELFQGTINCANVYPREIVKIALAHNAATIILAHNHPSGHAEPSRADREITQQLINALQLIDVRVLDHIVIGYNAVSFAERGLL